MGNIQKIIAAGALVAALYSGWNCVSNVGKWNAWDQNVTRSVAVANSAMTAEKTEGTVSMEESLLKAFDGSKYARGQNTAIIFNTDYSDVDTFRLLAKDASIQAHDIGQLKFGLESGVVPPDAADWVKTIARTLQVGESASPLTKRLAYSEQGQTIASAYEGLNDVIAGGGTRTTGDVSNQDRSLVEMLGQAAGVRAVLEGSGTDYKMAAAHVQVSVIYANMGRLDKAAGMLQEAYELMDKYPDSDNLSVRGTETMNQGVIKKSIMSAMIELKKLDQADASVKYSAGWWDRVGRFNESVGGHEVPCLTDIALNIGGGYSRRALWQGLSAAMLLCVAGGAALFSDYSYSRY